MVRTIEFMLCMVLLAGCDRSSEYHYDNPPVEGHSIADLKRLCPADGTAKITRDMTLRAVVTANDLFGEFEKTLVVGDDSGGLEISIDHKAVNELFPTNAEVEIHCNGLAIGDYGGKPVLGAPPAGMYSVDRIPAVDLGRYIRVTDRNCGRRRAVPYDFSRLTTEDAGRYVRFEGVHFAETDAMWCDRDPDSHAMLTTERTLVDAAGRTLSVRTLAGCLYAKEPVPGGTGSINGIIDYFNGKFSLRVCNREIEFATSAMLPKACPSVAGYAGPTPKR